MEFRSYFKSLVLLSVLFLMTTLFCSNVAEEEVTVESAASAEVATEKIQPEEDVEPKLYEELNVEQFKEQYADSQDRMAIMCITNKIQPQYIAYFEEILTSIIKTLTEDNTPYKFIKLICPEDEGQCATAIGATEPLGFFYYKQGSDVKQAETALNPNALAAFFKYAHEPQASIMANDDKTTFEQLLEAKVEDDERLYIYMETVADSEEEKQLLEAANKLTHQAKIFIRHIAAAEGEKKTLFKVYRDVDARHMELNIDTSKTAEDLANTILRRRFPVFTSFSPQDVNEVLSSGDKFVLAFSNNTDECKKIIEQLRNTAETLIDKYLFVHMPFTDFSPYVEFFGLSQDKIQVLVFESAQRKHIFHPEAHQQSVHEGFDKFMIEVGEGSAELYTKSEPAFDNSEKVIKDLTSNTFEELVLGKEDIEPLAKTMIVLYYTENCRYCRQFKERYEELAETMKEDTEIAFTRLNIHTNDEFEITRVPTIRVWHTNDEGERNMHEFSGNPIVAGELEDFVKNIRLSFEQPAPPDEEMDEL